MEGNLFLRAREAIAGFVEISASHRLMGIDIHLVHQNVFAENILVSRIRYRTTSTSNVSSPVGR